MPVLIKDFMSAYTDDDRNKVSQEKRKKRAAEYLAYPTDKMLKTCRSLTRLYSMF